MQTKIETARQIIGKGATTVLINEASREHSYQMSIPTRDLAGDGNLCWRLIHHQSLDQRDIGCAVSIIESYEYLLSGAIPATEAIERLRCLRREYQRQGLTS